MLFGVDGMVGVDYDEFDCYVDFNFESVELWFGLVFG